MLKAVLALNTGLNVVIKMSFPRLTIIRGSDQVKRGKNLLHFNFFLSNEYSLQLAPNYTELRQVTLLLKALQLASEAIPWDY